MRELRDPDVRPRDLTRRQRLLVASAGDPDRGWVVVGVARDGDVYTDESTTIRDGDDVFVAGSDRAVQGFERRVE